jgi:hypothetical protein
VQSQKSGEKAVGADSFEIEASIFLLVASGLFFAMESLFHYEDFLHEITLKSVSPEALALVIGSAIIALVYFWLGYSCWRSSDDARLRVSGYCLFY